MRHTPAVLASPGAIHTSVQDTTWAPPQIRIVGLNPIVKALGTLRPLPLEDRRGPTQYESSEPRICACPYMQGARSRSERADLGQPWLPKLPGVYTQALRSPTSTPRHCHTADPREINEDHRSRFGFSEPWFQHVYAKVGWGLGPTLMCWQAFLGVS
ncbi:hypothetical protein N7468_009300 [Penicillium chermesinum]|uniref:Uncharacterized protein n=1 Tax=Penicillium chermesinum TaxID=63820 RepID=A0A9W9NHJ9_9EURO|nr:uncharacterized protein N7468_009300 [Penicillium chermesinum]KAJ5220096.1 hypothetical protein N7468_009300 [Penicillium chermesinum]